MIIAGIVVGVLVGMVLGALLADVRRGYVEASWAETVAERANAIGLQGYRASVRFDPGGWQATLVTDAKA